jgi:homoserine O-acetyltransferase
MMTPVRGLPTPAAPDLLSTTRADASRLAVARQVTLCRDGLVLESGAVLRPVVVSYEAYGQLSPARDNLILICHA